METKPKGKTTQNSISSDNSISSEMETKPKGKTTQNSISSDNGN